jgi:uncharacterized membrane protein
MTVGVSLSGRPISGKLQAPNPMDGRGGAVTSFHVYSGSHEGLERPEIRRIGIADILDALRRGIEDFRAKPSHIIFVALIYPIAGVVLARWVSGKDTFQLLYPLVAGFALIGPFAALGLYEISRRREQGHEPSWWDALRVRHSPALPSIAVLGLMLVIVLAIWLLVADALYAAIFAEERPASLRDLLARLLTTPEGWRLIIIGNTVGFLFAVVVLATTIVAFPIMLDRDCGVIAAVAASVRATLVNPLPVAAWGVIVAAGLVIGSLPLLAGLAVVMPILGHATWHLYRKLIVPPETISLRS